MSRVGAALGLARSLAIYYGQPWKRRRMDALYAGFVRPGDLCFDVGAHVGNRIGCFRRLGATVVAVEPQPACVGVLRRLYGQDPAVTLIEAGCGSRIGRLELRISDRTPTVSTFDPSFIAEVCEQPSWNGVSWDRRVEVQVTTLDALIAAHGVPAFAKIDVEGFELEVLRGLGEPLAGLSFEFLPASVPRAIACVDRLEALAVYRYQVTLAERHALGPVFDADGLRAWLAALAPDAPSGDVFCRRVGSAVARRVAVTRPAMDI